MGFHFRIEVGGTSVARITNSHLASIAAKQYVLELDDHLEGPLRSVVLGALVGMEVSLAQREHHIP